MRTGGIHRHDLAAEITEAGNDLILNATLSRKNCWPPERPLELIGWPTGKAGPCFSNTAVTNYVTSLLPEIVKG